MGGGDPASPTPPPRRRSRTRRSSGEGTVDILGFVANLVSDYTLRQVAIGSAALGIVNGVLGSFAVLRKQSLLGDGISHAAWFFSPASRGCPSRRRRGSTSFFSGRPPPSSGRT